MPHPLAYATPERRIIDLEGWLGGAIIAGPLILLAYFSFRRPSK